MRLEPTPTGRTGTDGSRLQRNRDRSSTVAGRTSHSAGPPVRNQMKSASEPPRSTAPSKAGMSRLAVLIGTASRSEEHTSELQSLMRNSYAVFCLKKKKTQHQTTKKI